ncbi:MAG TPA: extracellular solute-binding protein [Candidatus Acidoferrales bacterium]|nr:extracellular solute-binding protein [Candidatus Acidoferrales bacterium]
MRYLKGAFLSAVICVLGLYAAARAETRIGKTLDEIGQLGSREGMVRIATSWEPENEPIFEKAFNQKYPKIKIELNRVSGIDTRERILNEAIAGIVDNDIVNVSGELRQQYIKAGVMAGPLEWRKLFPGVKETHFSPDGYFVLTAFSKYVIAYNPSLVPKDKVPKRWEDCLDPYWKGKFVTLVRPRTFTALYKAWGEEKLLSYAKRLKDNQPVWKSGQSAALTQTAAGEYPMVCGMAYHSIKGVQIRDPKINIAMSIPSELPFHVGEALAVMKGAKHPNAAVLLAGWLLTPEGQKGYDLEGSSSPFVEGTETAKLLKQTGAKPIWAGWEELKYEADVAKKIVAAWGFPKAGK